MIEQISLKEEQLQIVVEKARKKFIAFCALTDPKYQAQWFHKIIAERLENALQRLEEGKPSRIIIEMPPRHGKSELATVKFPAYCLGKHPDWPIIVSSYNSNLADKFGQKTRDLMTSDRYKAVFDTELRQDSRAKGRWMTTKDGVFLSSGVGGSITGEGFKIGIIDDPIKNREEADSETYRENVWDWYRSTFYTRQEGYGIIIVILTRWHLDDLVGRLEAQEEASYRAKLNDYDIWEYITFPAIATQEEQQRKKGEVLWPEKFDRGFMEREKNAIGAYNFSALYQQHPIPSETQEFDRKWFKHFEYKEMRDKHLMFYTTFDPAISESADADNWVVTTIGKERNGPNIYRIEETVGKGHPEQSIDAFFSHYDKYRGKMSLETIAFQKSLIYFITEEQKRRGSYFAIYELSNNRRVPKEFRIRGLIPLYRAGVIFHNADDGEYEHELLEFPFGKHDDRIDAMANFLELLQEQGQTQYDDGEDPTNRKRSLDPYMQPKRIFS